MKSQAILDLYFLDARSKLIDLAAFLDRFEKADGEEDFRMKAFRKALSVLNTSGSQKAKTVLLVFSDPTTEPISSSMMKSAIGAWPGTPFSQNAT